MPPRARIHLTEFEIMRRRFVRVGENWQLLVVQMRREIPGAAVPELIKQIWRESTDRQLRRRVREAIKSRVQE